MAIPVQCTCGKRYRVPDHTRGKRIRCKECGEELTIPRQVRKPSDAELDLSEINERDGVADDSAGAELPPHAGHPAKKKGRQRAAESDQSSTGNIFVRSAGILVFVATLGNCAYQYHAEMQALADAPRKELTIPFFMWGLLPIPIIGLLGLYIAYVGEEPDPEARRENRARGLINCAIGVAMIVVGIVLTVVVTVVMTSLAGIAIAFTGLIIGGCGVIIYGGLSAITGREFSKTRFHP
jgi:hypothetical protein